MALEEFHVALDAVPRVFVEIIGAGTITGTGVVHVADYGDPREPIRSFLAKVDPGELERKALEKLGDVDGGALTTGGSFLAALKEMLG